MYSLEDIRENQPARFAAFAFSARGTLIDSRAASNRRRIFLFAAFMRRGEKHRACIIGFRTRGDNVRTRTRMKDVCASSKHQTSGRVFCHLLRARVISGGYRAAAIALLRARHQTSTDRKERHGETAACCQHGMAA